MFTSSLETDESGCYPLPSALPPPPPGKCGNIAWSGVSRTHTFHLVARHTLTLKADQQQSSMRNEFIHRLR